MKISDHLNKMKKDLFLKYDIMRKKSHLILSLLFLTFINLSEASAQDLRLSLLGNTIFYSFIGKSNITGFSIRNLMISGEFGREFFYAKGEIDINPYNISFFTEKIESDTSAVPEFLNSQIPQDQGIVRFREAFISTRGLPLIRITLGRIFGKIGESNSDSFWVRNFVERPFTIRKFFGYDGFLDEGLEFSFSPPLPWTLEIAGQILDGSEKPWNSKGALDLVGVIAIRNLFGDDRTNGGFGIFWAAGKNDSSQRLSLKGTSVVSDNNSEFFGGDAFFNFNPFFSVRLGYIIQRASKPTILDIEGGLFTEFSVRPVDFFKANIRPEIFGIPRIREEGGITNSLPQIFELSIAADFIPLYFTKIRIQWTGNFGEKRLPQNIFYLQGIFNID